MMPLERTWFVLALSSVVAACAPGSVCTPGATMACVCADGRSGAQSCSSDGSGFGTCSCAGDGGLPTDGGSVVCTPGETVSCMCGVGGGLTGTQTCNATGTGFDTCNPCTPPTCSPSCALGFVCTGTTCTLNPSSRWDLVVEEVTVPSVGCGGTGWDSTISSTPNEADPVVIVTIGSASVAATMTSTCSDTSHCMFTAGRVADQPASALLAYLHFDVQDEDLTSNDEIGAATVPASTVMSAFGGGQQTTSAAAACSTSSVAGFGPLHWHLSPH